MPTRIRDIEKTVTAGARPRLRDLRTAGGGLLPIVWVGIGLSVFQQFVGINVIFYYSTALWHSVGFTEADSMRISTITGVINIVTTLIAIAFVDRVRPKAAPARGLRRHGGHARHDGVALRPRSPLDATDRRS